MHSREPVHFSEIRSSMRLPRNWLAGAFLIWAIAAQGAEAPEVAALLDAAEAAERQSHLIYPAKGSAMSLYHAEEALASEQFLKADSMVSKARMIYPDYPAVTTMQRKIELLESASRTRITLDWRLVAERSNALTADLEKLGRRAKSGDCRVSINVSNDSEGRWIYRKMNGAQGERRLKAEVKIASPAAVEIVCFDTASDDA
jgi:rubrerythrin